MIGPDRRKTPRTTLDKHAYINIEPNNGGIVLNVSEGGLCFHAFDPVQRNGTVRFWFMQHNQRIEADAEVTWTDATQKGGLRFKTLPAEAREQIRSWMDQNQPVAVGYGVAAAAAVAVPAVLSPLPSRNAAPVDLEPSPANESPLVLLPQTPPALTVRVPSRGFSSGFAAGLAVSLFVIGLFLFHIYRSQIGESLIKLGEQFASRPTTQAQSVAPLPETAAPSPQIVSQPQVTTLAPPRVAPPSPQPSIPVQPKSSPAPPPATENQKPQPPQQKMVDKAGPAPVADSVPNPPPSARPSPSPEVPAIVDAREIASTRPMIPLPRAEVAADAKLIPANSASEAPPSANSAANPTDNSRVESARSTSGDATSQMFFEVGGFKNKQQAHNTTEKLAELGFHATAIHKNHLWLDAYHVVVGPYTDDDEASATHQNLLSHGFKPRPYERGSRTLILRSGVTLNGTRVPVGECVVSWESYVSDAVVKVVHDNDIVTTTSGKWVKRPVKYPDDAYVYRTNKDGSRTLIEVRFSGMRQALVFGKPS